MAEADIPVDLFNPGQVFACLGFLEAAEILLGDAEGGFDWHDEGNVRFRMRAGGECNPFEKVLDFLATAEIIIVCPVGIEGPWPIDSKVSPTFPASYKSLEKSDGKGFSASNLPIKLYDNDKEIPISHWMKHGQLNTMKLFAGQQVAATLAMNMLHGDDTKKGARGFRHIYPDIKKQKNSDPFNIVCAVGGRFGFDARGSWDSMRTGASLDQQGTLVEISPHVELLAAVGLENSRPNLLSTYQIEYAAWCEMLPVSLCRVSLFSSDLLLPEKQCRFFRAHLGNDKQYKKIFFAEEERG